MGSVCNRDTCDVRRLRWYDDFLLLRGRSTVGDSPRVRPRLANIHAVDKRICGTGGLCTVDCRRIRLLRLWHVARKHGDAGGRLICHARVLHRIQHGAARCGFGRAILDWRGASGGGVADQSVVRAACPLAISPHVRFSRIRRSDWFVRCTNVRFW